MADGPAGFRQGFTCPALLRIPISFTLIAHTGLSPSMAELSSSFWFFMQEMSWSYNPSRAVTLLVWASPRSLATTYGITFVFFSSAYLDVSVQRVCPPIGVLHLQCSGLPHSEIFGYSACVPLPEAYRSLSRPSSPLRA